MENVLWKARLFGLARGAARRMHPIFERSRLARLGVFKALKRSGKQRMMRWLESGNLLLIQIDGLPMYIFNRPHFLGAHVTGPYEPYTLNLFKDAIKPGATVLDIGANVGCFTLVAARQAGTNGRVYAFEPGPDNLPVLARNVEINGFRNVTIVPKAVSDKQGVAQLVLGADSDQHSLFGPPMVAATGSVTVDCVALDDVLQQPPDVIKLDIEGNEISALDGMRRTLERSQSVAMFVELNPVCLRQANREPEDLVSRLREFDFEIQVIDEHQSTLRPFTDNYLREIRNQPRGWFANLYCTKKRSPRPQSTASSIAIQS